MNETKQIYKALAEINKEITAIAKDKKNPQQNYNFRGIDDVFNELHSLFAKHEVFIISECKEINTIEKPTKTGGLMLHHVAKLSYQLIASDGSSIQIPCIIGEAMDSGDKGINKTYSAALKILLLQMFLIPTIEPKDTENETHELTKPDPKKEPAKKQEAKKEPVKPPVISKPQLDNERFQKAVEMLSKDTFNAIKALLRCDLSKTQIEQANKVLFDSLKDSDPNNESEMTYIKSVCDIWPLFTQDHIDYLLDINIKKTN
jgi:hypothetical protein